MKGGRGGQQEEGKVYGNMRLTTITTILYKSINLLIVLC